MFRRPCGRWSFGVDTLGERACVPSSGVFLPTCHRAHTTRRRALESRGATVVNLDRYGNTSAASIPIALAEAADAGRIAEGDLVLLSGFGSGMTWASALLRWETS